MIKKTKYRYRRFRQQNVAYHPDLFQTFDMAVEGIKFLAFAAIIAAIFYLI